jgi:zinc protease
MKTAKAERRSVRSKQEIHCRGKAGSALNVEIAAPIVVYCVIVAALYYSAVSVFAQQPPAETVELHNAGEPSATGNTPKASSLTSTGSAQPDESKGVQELDGAAMPPSTNTFLPNRAPVPGGSSDQTSTSTSQIQLSPNPMLPANAAIPSSGTDPLKVPTQAVTTSSPLAPVATPSTSATQSLFMHQSQSTLPGSTLVPTAPAIPDSGAARTPSSVLPLTSPAGTVSPLLTPVTPSSLHGDQSTTVTPISQQAKPQPVNANGILLPQELVLPNGLRVVLLEEHSFPVVSCLVWYRVGSRNEVPGLTGVSHLVEHLLFQNIGNFKKNEFGASIVANGGQFNGFTSEDFTAFYSTVAPSRLDLVLHGEAERMRNAKFVHADVQPEVNSLLREFDEEARDPITSLNREVHAIAFQQHPYRNPPGGWRSDTERLTYEDARAFYDRFFYPDNASLILVGDFKKEMALPLVKKYFLTLPKSAFPIPPMRVVERMRPYERRVTMKYGGKKESLVVAYPAPAIADADAPAVTVLEKLLNAQISGRLRKQLVDTRVCSSAQGVFEIKRDPSLFIMTLNASAGTPLPKVLDASDAIISQLRSQLITDPELSRARKQAEFEFFNETDGPYLDGFHLGYFETLMNWQTAFSWPEKIRSVNAVDIQRVARLYLSNDSRVVGQLVSTAAVPPAGTKPAAPGGNNQTDRPTVQKNGPTEAVRPDPNTMGPVAIKRFPKLRLAAYKPNDASLEPLEIAESENSADQASTSETSKTSSQSAAARSVVETSKKTSEKVSSKSTSETGKKTSEKSSTKPGAETSKKTSGKLSGTSTSETTKKSSEKTGIKSSAETGKKAGEKVTAKTDAETSKKGSEKTSSKSAADTSKRTADAGSKSTSEKGKKSDEKVGSKTAAEKGKTTDEKASSKTTTEKGKTTDEKGSSKSTAEKGKTTDEKASSKTATEKGKTSAPNQTPPVKTTTGTAATNPAQKPGASTQNLNAQQKSAASQTTKATPPGQTTQSSVTAPRMVEPVTQAKPVIGTPAKSTTLIRSEPLRPTTFGSVSYRALPNGLEVVIIESHLNPVVQVVGCVRAGSVFESPDKRGLAGLTGLAMSYGKTNRQQAISDQDDMGLPPKAMIKFDVGLEEINFQTRCLSKDFPTQLTRLVACLREPHFQDADIEKAKSDLLAGISQSEDSVSTKVERALLRSVMPSSSLYYPVDPTEKAKSISTLKPSDVKDYYSSHVTPNLTALVIAGDVQTKQVLALLDHLSAGWNAKKDLVKPPVLTTERHGSKSSLPLKDSTQSLVCLGRLIGAEESSDKTWSDLLIADCALTNHPIFSRINQRLESEPNLAAGFRAEALKAHLQPLSEAIIWSLYLPVDTNSASSSVASIQNELKHYSKAGITVQELTEAKRYLLGSIPVNRMANLETLSKFYLEGLLQRREPEPFAKVAAAIRAASLDSVNKFIMSGFKPDQAALVVAGNRQLIKQVHPAHPEASEAQ